MNSTIGSRKQFCRKCQEGDGSVPCSHQCPEDKSCSFRKGYEECLNDLERQAIKLEDAANFTRTFLLKPPSNCNSEFARCDQKQRAFVTQDKHFADVSGLSAPVSRCVLPASASNDRGELLQIEDSHAFSRNGVHDQNMKQSCRVNDVLQVPTSEMLSSPRVSVVSRTDVSCTPYRLKELSVRRLNNIPEDLENEMANKNDSVYSKDLSMMNFTILGYCNPRDATNPLNLTKPTSPAIRHLSLSQTGGVPLRSTDAETHVTSNNIAMEVNGQHSWSVPFQSYEPNDSQYPVHAFQFVSPKPICNINPQSSSPSDTSNSPLDIQQLEKFLQGIGTSEGNFNQAEQQCEEIHQAQKYGDGYIEKMEQQSRYTDQMESEVVYNQPLLQGCSHPEKDPVNHSSVNIVISEIEPEPLSNQMTNLNHVETELDCVNVKSQDDCNNETRFVMVSNLNNERETSTTDDTDVSEVNKTRTRQERESDETCVYEEEPQSPSSENFKEDSNLLSDVSGSSLHSDIAANNVDENGNELETYNCFKDGCSALTKSKVNFKHNNKLEAEEIEGDMDDYEFGNDDMANQVDVEEDCSPNCEPSENLEFRNRTGRFHKNTKLYHYTNWRKNREVGFDCDNESYIQTNAEQVPDFSRRHGTFSKITSAAKVLMGKPFHSEHRNNGYGASTWYSKNPCETNGRFAAVKNRKKRTDAMLKPDLSTAELGHYELDHIGTPRPSAERTGGAMKHVSRVHHHHYVPYKNRNLSASS